MSAFIWEFGFESVDFLMTMFDSFLVVKLILSYAPSFLKDDHPLLLPKLKFTENEHSRYFFSQYPRYLLARAPELLLFVAPKIRNSDAIFVRL